jgi:hypothetical protein
MQTRTKLFVILWIAGMTGILSFLLVDLSALVSSLPVTAGKEMPFSPPIMGVLSLIQPTVLMSLAVLVGTRLAHKVLLSAPVAEAAAARKNLVAALKPQIFPGVMGGIVGGIAILVSWLLWKPFLPALFVIQAEKFNRLMPVLTRLLSGGITEELLLRWGLMTVLVWVSWRLFQGVQGRPPTICFVGAIVISSVIFGIGHLPIVAALGAGFTIPIVAYVIIANSMFGFIAGYLYWKRGLEAAIIAHMTAHLIIITAMYVGT